MPELTSTPILSPGTGASLHPDTNPGRNSSGPSWPPTGFDHLRLPSGAKIGDSSNEALRAKLTRLGIEGIGRDALAAKYAKQIADVAKAGADKAVAEWLQNHRS